MKTDYAESIGKGMQLSNLKLDFSLISMILATKDAAANCGKYKSPS